MDPARFTPGSRERHNTVDAGRLAGNVASVGLEDRCVSQRAQSTCKHVKIGRLTAFADMVSARNRCVTTHEEASMRQLNANVAVLLFSALLMAGCGPKASYSDMSPSAQADLTKNLEVLAEVYRITTIENGKSPASWSDLEKRMNDVEAEIDLQVIKDSGYSINWGLAIEAVTGEDAGQVVVAQAAADSPILYIDGVHSASP